MKEWIQERSLVAQLLVQMKSIITKEIQGVAIVVQMKRQEQTP